MLGKIKKSLKYFSILIGIIIFLPTVLYLLLQTASVQTFLVKRVTRHFSSELKSTISVGSIEYKLFNKLSIKNLLIKDKNNDTLLYTRELNAGIWSLNFKKKSYRLGKVNLIKPVIALITDSTGQMNLTWYLDMLKNPSDTVKKGGGSFTVAQVDINHARFSLINRKGVRGKTKIDFNNMRLSDLNGIIEDFKIINDTTSFNIYNLGFRESSGFAVNKMNSSVVISGQNIHLKSAYINMGTSVLNMPLFSLTADTAGAFKNFTEKVKLNILLDKSQISSNDLKYFIPKTDSLNESVWISGKILGTVSELRGRDIKLTYRNYTSLDCDFDCSGLPNFENAYLFIGVNSLKTNAKDIEAINLPGNNKIVIPDPVKNLGNISFNGSFTGFTTDFVTYGEIRTSKGNIRTDISVRPEKPDRYRVKGLLTGTNINIGELTGNTELLGKMSMQTNVDGYAYSLKKFTANLTGKIDSIELNKYVYRNITLNGVFTEKTWDGSINIVDKNIKLDLLGLLNFKNTLPEFDFTLNIADANLYNLHFDKLDTTSSVTMLLTSNFKGSNIDNLDGEIKLLNSNFKKYNHSLELYDFSIRTYTEDQLPVLSLRTDFLDADIKGYYNLGGLGEVVKSTLGNLMPSQFRHKGKPNSKKNNFNFNINFKNTDKINAFFKTGILIADKSYIKGSIQADSLISIRGNSGLFSIKNLAFTNLSFDTKVIGAELALDVKSSAFNVLGQSDLKDFNVGLRTKPDNFNFKVDWDNRDTVLNRGSIIAKGNLAIDPNTNRTVLKVDIDSTSIYSANNRWKLNNSSVLIDSSTFNIRNLTVASNDRFYMVNGAISENPADTLHLKFKGISIDPLNYLLDKKKENDPTAVRFALKGHVSGNIILSNVYKNLLLAGNIYIDKFSMLGSEFGNISINSSLNTSKKYVNIEASNNLNSVKMFDITGGYEPSTKRIDLTAVATKLPITFLNPLLKTFASEITGEASGKLVMSGQTDNFALQGAILPEKASMKINYLNTKYSLNDSVRFDKKGIKFNNIKILDSKGNGAILSGYVNHRNFKDYEANVTITINSSSFLVLNTQLKDNPMFYGTVYASGSKNDPTVANIRSDQSGLAFEISAKTGKNSKLAIPLSKGLSVSEYSYISFSDSNKDKKDKKDQKDVPVSNKQTGIDLNMNLEVTPDAEVQIIFDSKAGDIMKGQGSSENLNVNLNKKGDFKVTGDYVIEKGEYTFTLGNIVNKPFSVENGGRIMFNGDMKDADIDLKASYLNLKASLFPVLQENQYLDRISVEPQINLTGKLFNPIVGFDIYLPDADETTRTLLKNYISTEDEMTKQVVALLVMQSFISSSSTGGITSSSTPSGTSAMAATTYEMVSSRVSDWFSQLSKDFNIGLNIRPGETSLTPQEAQVALSTQLLNNKVVLNGNFDVKGAEAINASPTGNTNQLTGDFDAEIRLNEKFKFKVFNRFNDTYNTGLSQYTQGVGIFYRQDFNKFSDLFSRKKKSEMKKEEETKIQSAK